MFIVGAQKWFYRYPSEGCFEFRRVRMRGGYIRAACGSTSYQLYRSIRSGISAHGQYLCSPSNGLSAKTCIHVGTVAVENQRLAFSTQTASPSFGNLGCNSLVLATSKTATTGVLPVLACAALESHPTIPRLLRASHPYRHDRYRRTHGRGCDECQFTARSQSLGRIQRTASASSRTG